MSASAGYSLAPGDVSPGHMMLAPLKTNLIAPLSTCWCGRIKGSVKEDIFICYNQVKRNVTIPSTYRDSHLCNNLRVG